jgi:polysaccharide export outer membrane protein
MFAETKKKGEFYVDCCILNIIYIQNISMRNWLCVFLMPVLFLLGSCATGKYPVTRYGHAIPDSLFYPIEYKLRPGDKVSVQSYNTLTSVGLPESAGSTPGAGGTVPVYETVVDNEGYIPIPRGGRVFVNGMTQKEAIAGVKKAYEKTINNPEFDLTVTSMKVNVLGAVNTQGTYVMTRENMTLSDAFALAGGVKYENMSKKLMIIRGGRTMEFDVNAAQMGDPRLNAIIIKDNDVVYVKPSGASISAPKISQYTAFLAPIGTILSAITLYTTIQSLRKD